MQRKRGTLTIVKDEKQMGATEEEASFLKMSKWKRKRKNKHEASKLETHAKRSQVGNLI